MATVNDVLLKPIGLFSDVTKSEPKEPNLKYQIRWFMLFILTVCNACLILHYPQYTIIANVVVEFYDVSYQAVNWTAMIIFALYIPTIFPAMYIINKIGLRGSVLTAMTAITAASWLKVGSAAPDRFWMVMIAQALIAIAHPFLLTLPAQFASAWFGVEQTALACGIAILGNEIGITLGFYLPTLAIHYSKDKDEVAYEMKLYNTITALVCTTIGVLTYVFFKSNPPTPPSEAQKQLEAIGKIDFKKSTMLLFRNASFVIFLVVFSMSVGIYYAVPTLFNQIILQYYPGATDELGKISVFFTIVGIPSTYVGCYVLSKSQQYRLVTISVFALYLVGAVMFTLAPLHSLPVVYVAAAVYGFFMAMVYAVCLEVAAELTYPVPESTSSGYLIASAQISGIALTYLYSYILYNHGAFWSNTLTCVQLLISTLLVICMKFKYRRRAAEELHKSALQA